MLPPRIRSPPSGYIFKDRNRILSLLRDIWRQVTSIQRSVKKIPMKRLCRATNPSPSLLLWCYTCRGCYTCSFKKHSSDSNFFCKSNLFKTWVKVTNSAFFLFPLTGNCWHFAAGCPISWVQSRLFKTKVTCDSRLCVEKIVDNPTCWICLFYYSTPVRIWSHVCWVCPVLCWATWARCMQTHFKRYRFYIKSLVTLFKCVKKNYFLNLGIP